MDSQYKQFEYTAELMKAVAHPLRICILNGLRERPNITVSEMNTCLENVPQSTLSQHLSVLRRAGLIKAEHRGKYVEYELANKKVERFINILLNEGLV